ncbi:tumor necrosis factor ligand superfamily member 10-like isoform X1 [Ambystoma mexicanum]|uniref:tumor necrosis factor ligand superfamily member 10-like isoform X1 n=1 Tax=Ambystoma mexicanum TaxID=8296 RepID=UPI0037E76BA4
MAHHQQTNQYYRTSSSDSAACMMGPRGGGTGEEELGKEAAAAARKAPRKCSPVWPAMAVMGILALQIASTTGLFVYFTMSISKLKAQTQGISEELKCLQYINSLEEMDPAEADLRELFMNEACQRMAGTIRSYITMVTEKIIRTSLQKETRPVYVNNSEFQMPRGLSSKSSAHLTLHTTSHHGVSPPESHGFGTLHQSCRHPIRRWEDKNIWSHRQNVSYHEGRLKITHAGKYYVYSQIYFRYPQQSEHAAHATSQQLVQCVHKKTSYVHPILLLKGVGTKCWAPNAEYGLHSVHQAGVFELRAGDELFVSVSSLAMLVHEETASYFGTFKLDG